MTHRTISGRSTTELHPAPIIGTLTKVDLRPIAHQAGASFLPLDHGFLVVFQAKTYVN